MPGPNRFIVKEVKAVPTADMFCDINGTSRGNAFAQIGATHYPAQLGLPDWGKQKDGCLLSGKDLWEVLDVWSGHL